MRARTTTGAGPEEERHQPLPRGKGWLSIVKWGAALLVVALAVVFSASVRLQAAYSLPQLDRNRPEGVLKSDPALLYYLTQRVVEAGGGVPDDFRADPRLEYPEHRDLAAMFTVGQEFLVAWAYLLLGGDLPLHAFALVFMAVLASLSALGVYGLTAELTRSPGWSVFAVLLYATSWTSYRTASFIFMREDLSLPLYAIHLWLLARAARRRGVIDYLLVGLSLLLAVSTWHATTFVVAVEASVLFGWSLWSGRNPMAARRAWLVPTLVAAGSLLVPVLRAKLFVLSPPMQLAMALLLAAWLARRCGWTSRGRYALLHLAALGACAGVAQLLGWGIEGPTREYTHVFSLLWAKLQLVGQRPDNPAELSFGARIMWQGPFSTGSLATLFRHTPASLLLVALALPGAAQRLRRRREDVRGPLLVFFAAAWVALSLLIWRTRVVFALTGPAAAALALTGRRRAPAVVMAALLVLAQFAWLGQRITHFTSGWYQPRHQRALRATIEWIRENLPPEGAIASDAVNSTAILAHTRHPIVLQPKYETRESRERLERFVTTLYGRRPEAFARVLRDEFRASYLLVDADMLHSYAYLAGRRGLPARSAAAALLDPRAAPHERPPGLRLLYRAPAHASDLRLYRIE